MNNKRRKILLAIIYIAILILILWISGIIPKQIAKVSATNYLKENFPKLQLEYEDIEWSSSFGAYSVKFKDKNNKTYGFLMNNKYFPVSPGQGIFAIEEEYREKYGEQNAIKYEEQIIPKTIDDVSIEIKSGTLTRQGVTIIITNNSDSTIGYGEWFRVDKKLADKWVKAEIINKDYIFDAIGIMLQARKSVEEKIDWSDIYGTLSNGQYRFVWRFDGKYIATEFSIYDDVDTIDIETAFETNEKKVYTLNQEEIYQILDIIENVNFKKETCDGLPNYYIRFNSENEKGFVSYGVEIYNNEYHITSVDKGEAILSNNQKEQLEQIINKYFNEK